MTLLINISAALAVIAFPLILQFIWRMISASPDFALLKFPWKKKMRKQALLPVTLMLLAFLVGCAESAAAQGAEQIFAKPELVRPFRVEIDQKRIDAILQRVRTAKLPRQMPAPSADKAAWETGADIQWLEGLRQYWTTQFNWRAAEARLNRYPQYKARVDGVDIHFYYVKGEGSKPLPLLLTHGWPGSVVEFLDVIGPLTSRRNTADGRRTRSP